MFHVQYQKCCEIPSGKRLHNYGKSPFSVGKSTIYYFHYVKLPEGTSPAAKTS